MPSVLQIGDSHSVLAYGVELNRLLRSTGAAVNAYASSGSSPLSWVSGYTAKTTGVPTFLVIAPDGSQTLTPPGVAHATPSLASLMTQTSPDAVVISLGANMRWMTPAQVASSAATLAKIATGGGAKLVWVGPPPQKSDIADRSDYDAFCSRLGAAVAPYGAFINSSPFVPTYAGTDGIHYNDARGAAIATAWADDVFGVMYPASTAPASAAPSLGELVAWVSLATVTVFGARHALKRLRHRVAVVH